MNKISFEWLHAAIIRAIKTMAQTALGMLTVGVALSDINWAMVGSVSAVAGIYSILTSLTTNLPEIGTDGILEINTSDPEKDIYRIVLDDDVAKLSEKKTVKIKVNKNIISESMEEQ